MSDAHLLPPSATHAEVAISRATARLADAIARLEFYIADNHRLGRDITRAGLIAAVCTAGVQNVALASPATDVEITPLQASWCTGHAVTVGGYDE